MSAKRKLLTNILLPTMVMGMMGANTFDYIREIPKSPPRLKDYKPSRCKTDEERIQHKLHQKKIKARRNARRRKKHGHKRGMV